MARRDQDIESEISERESVCRDQITLSRLQVSRGVRQVHRRGRLRRGLDVVLRTAVTRMGVGEDDPLDAQTVKLGKDFRRITARVDYDGFPGIGAGDDVAVGVFLADVHLLNRETGHDLRLVLRLATLYAVAEARPVVKYTFLKVTPMGRGWAVDEREAAVHEFTDLLEGSPTAESLLTYSTVGLRGDCDLLIWQAADAVDAIQRAESQWRGTRLGPYLRVAHSFLAMMKPSPYLGRHKHPDQEGRRTRLKPSGGRYLFVYPMWKKRIWYRLAYDKRKAMMVEHFAIGPRSPQVKINTAYSFGLDDQEFVVAFECDEPAAFLDLVMELRGSQAGRYTERETPIFTCVLMAPADALQLALGLSGEAHELQRQVSLIAGG